MNLDYHYVDPRLVALYDSDNPRGADTDFYVALAAQLEAQLIFDLGCGTGLLTRELADGKRRVVGVDPAAAMLAYARQQPGAERVQWLEGTSRALGTPAADLVIMTGNVAQVFLEDDEWATTLRDIHTALRRGGHLAFECRNPDAQAWTTWNRQATFARIDSPYGQLECWLELISIDDGKVCFQGHNVFLETGEDLVVRSTLRFRTLAEQRQCLTKAGFVIDQLYGDWHGAPFTSTSRLLIFVAHRI